MKRILCALALFVVLAAGVRADEIRLKDGSKIVGTIVDFENDSFKVQTSFGFALVRKDSIAQIIPSEPVRPASATATPAPAVSNASAAVSSSAAKLEPQPAVARGSAAAATPATTPAVASPAPSRTSAPAVAATALAMPAPNPRPASPAATPAAATAAPVPAPPVAPPPVRDLVQGNLYTNQTYGFQLYRPPGWELMPEARKALPNAITAIGTGDQTTLFVVGREALRDSLDSHVTIAERAMRQIYENYRPLSLTRLTVAGLPAVQWRFRGMADGHDWSVTALTVARGSDVFTLLGMTYADSDLIQIRENVIAKMIASLQFTPAR